MVDAHEDALLDAGDDLGECLLDLQVGLDELDAQRQDAITDREPEPGPDGDALAACFDASGGIDEAFVKELAKHQPLRVVFRDAGYKNSAAKINVEQIFKLVSPVTEVKCI